MFYVIIYLCIFSIRKWTSQLERVRMKLKDEINEVINSFFEDKDKNVIQVWLRYYITLYYILYYIMLYHIIVV